MPQRKKDEVRQAILGAAAGTFATVGFERATLGDIAACAGTSIGNLYKYFPNKEALFEAFLPPDFVVALQGKFRARVAALAPAADAFALDENHPYRRASEELLRFTLEHRERIVFLLLRAEGTRHAPFRGELVRLLVGLALGHARQAHHTFSVTAGRKRALARIYRGFVASLASILEQERAERAVREAVALQTIYHLSGLKAFFNLRDESV